jgi:hypothetical protein
LENLALIAEKQLVMRQAFVHIVLGKFDCIIKQILNRYSCIL